MAEQSPNSAFASFAVPQAQSVLRASGIYGEPSANTQSMGFDINGKPLYGDKGLLQSKDPTLGAKNVSTLKNILDPMGVFSDKDYSTIDKISNTASDVGFIAQLTDMYNRGDKKGFVNTTLNKFQQPIIQGVTSDPNKQAGLASAFTAWNLYNNWGQMSDAQKGLGLANFGIQGYKFASGENLAAKQIVAPTTTTPGLNVGQALGLFSAGYNAYSLAKNWNQMNTLQKIAGGTGTVAQVANLGQSFGMLGSGTTGAATATSAQALSQAGWQAAPHMGIGAMTADVGSQIPAGYTSVTEVGGKVVIAPTGNASVAQSTASQGAGFIGTAAGVASIAMGSKQVYDSWGKGGKANTINGAIGGSAIAAGMYGLGVSNPYVLAGVVAASALGANVKSKESQRGASLGAGSALTMVSGGLVLASPQVREALYAPFKSGKSETQVSRDMVRQRFSENGAVDKDFQFTLADGSKASIGVDGDQGRHAFTDPSKAVAGKDVSHLNSYDTDYTNDLDYTAALGGITLSRLMTGGKATNIDQVGSQVGNAALSNIGYGKDFSAGNYNTLMSNMKAFYSQSGIKSKSDALQLLNQAYAEHRIDDSDHVSGMQALNMVYDDDGYQTAQKLMAGRFRGIEVAANEPTQAATPMTGVNSVKLNSEGNVPQSAATPSSGFLRSKEDAVARNRQTYQQAA